MLGEKEPGRMGSVNKIFGSSCVGSEVLTEQSEESYYGKSTRPKLYIYTIKN